MERLGDGRAGKLGEWENASWRPQFEEAQATLQSHSVIEPAVSHTVRLHLRLWVSVLHRFHVPLLNHCAGVHSVVT